MPKPNSDGMLLLPSAEAGPRSSGVMFFESGYSNDLMTQIVLLTTLSKNTPPRSIGGNNTYRLSVGCNFLAFCTYRKFMKNILLTISFLFILTFSALSQADTISYWQVYLNNKPINEFSVTSVNPTVEIPNYNFSRRSILSIEYFKDNSCHNCRTFLVITDSNDNIIYKVKGYNTNKYSLKLKRLLYENDKSSTFKFYIKESPYQDQFLFTLTIKI